MFVFPDTAHAPTACYWWHPRGIVSYVNITHVKA